MQNPKEIMEAGWKARENLEFEKAEKLLKKALELFKEKEDWFNVTECLNHLAYNEKLKAVQSNQRGLEFTKESIEIAKIHETKVSSVLRALISLSSSAGLFEQALKLTEQTLQEDLKPLPKADMLSHKATFLLRTGNLQKAKEVIEEAEKLWIKYELEENEPHRSIWKSRLLMTKGLILFNIGERETGLNTLKDALNLSKEQNLKARISEIETLLESLKR
ncbi:MAG TPA: hypothetical protein PLT50_01505 [bacterium]|nr:hypothetical protein [bacterium]